MIKIIQKSGWLAGSLIFFMPILLVFFLGSQMAYGQVQRQFERYQLIPEVTSLAALEALPPNEVIIVRGVIEAAPGTPDAGLVVYQERPEAGRPVRFQEEFSLIFPEFTMALTDGSIQIVSSQTQELVIQHELHTVPAGDRENTGFQAGDTVTVQGRWQPGSAPILAEVTGISSLDQASLIAEWQSSFQQVSWVRNGLGLLALLSLILLIVQIRRTRAACSPDTDLPIDAEGEACPPQTPKTIPTT